MFNWLFGSKKESDGIKAVKEDTKKSFELVKKDISALSGWIKHLDSEKNLQKKDIEELKESLSTINSEIDGIKNVISLMGGFGNQQPFKKPKRVFNKQTAVYAVQTGVQTGVQTPNLGHFSSNEKAIVWILLNSDMNLSYDDLAVMMGKDRSTIRGQINAIRQKGGILIDEIIEKNGKKRVFIPDDVKEKLRKKLKVRVGGSKKP